MDLHKATRDPWVWGQLALFALVGLGAPLLPRYVASGTWIQCSAASIRSGSDGWGRH